MKAQRAAPIVAACIGTHRDAVYPRHMIDETLRRHRMDGWVAR
jgi:hypothetical protein